MFNKEIFKKRLKQLREAKKMTQSELSNELNIGRASISNYELGTRIPDASVLVSIAEYFNITTDYLLGSTQKPDNENFKIFNTLEYLKQIITESIKIYALAGIVINILNKLLENILESIDFYSFIIENGDLEKLSNKNTNLDINEKNKLIKDTKKRCKQMPLYLGKVSMDLNDLISHTQSLVDNVLENIETNNK